MATFKVQPKNLNNIKRHFEQQLSEARKKLLITNRKKVELEKAIETFKDGIEWCNAVYKRPTPKERA